MDNLQAHIVVDFGGIPAIVKTLQEALAEHLREVAAAEPDPRVCERIIAVADEFETAQIGPTARES